MTDKDSAMLSDEFKGVKDSLTGLGDNIIQFGRELSANQQSTNGLWHEVRAIGKKVDQLPGQMRQMIGDHEDDCLARERMRMKALEGNSSATIARPDPSTAIQMQPVAAAVAPPAFYIPRSVIYVIIFVGALLVGGGVFVGALLFGDQPAADVLRELGGRAAQGAKLGK